MEIKKKLMIELYRLLNGACLKNDYQASVKLPCGSELSVKIKAKNKLKIVTKAG